eukprot:scaffold29624_cov174-Isochrysis_galbana.AAC.2
MCHPTKETSQPRRVTFFPRTDTAHKQLEAPQLNGSTINIGRSSPLSPPLSPLPAAGRAGARAGTPTQSSIDPEARAKAAGPRSMSQRDKTHPRAQRTEKHAAGPRSPQARD